MAVQSATKADIDEAVGSLRESTKADLDEAVGLLRESTKADLKAEIGSVRSDLKAEIGSVRSDLKAEIGSVRRELDSKATKTDLLDLGKALRTEMASGYGRLALQIERQQNDARALGDLLARKMDALNSVVLGRLDIFTDRMETIWRESKTLPQVIDEQGRQLGNHEARIKSLEGRTI